MRQRTKRDRPGMAILVALAPASLERPAFAEARVKINPLL
jgi:hypothetical protein